MQVSEGRLREAAKGYRRSLELLQRLDRSGATDCQIDLFHLHVGIANLELQRGKGDDAQEAYHRSSSISRRLVTEEPDNPQLQAYVAISERGLGDVAYARGDLEGAEPAHREYFEIFERISGQDPSNVSWQNSLSAAASRLGILAERRGEDDEAVKWYGFSHAIMVELAADAPEMTHWHSISRAVGRTSAGSVASVANPTKRGRPTPRPNGSSPR